MDKFIVSFDGSVTLSKEDIWPDGDGPENPTLKDVIEVMKECGAPNPYWLDEWNLYR